MGSCENLFTASPETEKFLCDRLLDQNQPISERFRALFSLRNLRGPRPRNALIAGYLSLSLSLYAYIICTTYLVFWLHVFVCICDRFLYADWYLFCLVLVVTFFFLNLMELTKIWVLNYALPFLNGLNCFWKFQSLFSLMVLKESRLEATGLQCE